MRRNVEFPWLLRTFFWTRPALSILALLRDQGCAETLSFLRFCAPFPGQGLLSASLPFPETKGAQIQNREHLAAGDRYSFFEAPQGSGRLRLRGWRVAAAWAASERLRELLLLLAHQTSGPSAPASSSESHVLRSGAYPISPWLRSAVTCSTKEQRPYPAEALTSPSSILNTMSFSEGRWC